MVSKSDVSSETNNSFLFVLNCLNRKFHHFLKIHKNDMVSSISYADAVGGVPWPYPYVIYIHLIGRECEKNPKNTLFLIKSDMPKSVVLVNFSEFFAWGPKCKAVTNFRPKTELKNNFFCMKGKIFILSGNILPLI